jgi:hypothetical protein
MRPRVLLLTVGIAALAAGCTGSPTTVRQPRSPAFDGLGMGSGNLVDSTATQKAPSRMGAGTAAAGANEASVVPGLGMGSGN